MTPKQNLFDVKGKTVFVTGASSGIGRSAATCLANSGAKVVGIARRLDKLKEWSEDTEGETSYFTADVSNKNQIKNLVDKVVHAEGSPEILIPRECSSCQLTALPVRVMCADPPETD